MGVVFSLALTIAFGGAPVRAAQSEDVELTAGIAQAQQGDFEKAVLTLDAAARRLAGKQRPKELARAYLYLSIAYLGLSQEQTARAKFLEAMRTDRQMEFSPKEFPPKVLEFFNEAMKEAGLSQPPPGAARPPTPAPPPQPEKKGGKTGLIIVGVVGAGAAGVAIAAGGGGSGATATTVPANVPVLIAPPVGAVLPNGCPAPFQWDFDWSDIAGASRYQLFVIGASATIPLINNDAIPASQYSYFGSGFVASANANDWRWRVRANVGGVWGPYTTERVFNVALCPGR